MALQTSADIIVIGGGPGGSAAATMLARQGWQVLLLEREHFPRPHIGESLLPASIPILEELGVLPAVESAGFLKKWGATMVWGRDKQPWSWYFGETNRRYPHSYQVWRPLFDQLLLDNAAAQGVTVRQGCQVTQVLFETSAPSNPPESRPAGDSAHPELVEGWGQPADNPAHPARNPSHSDHPELVEGWGKIVGVQFRDESGIVSTISAPFVLDASGQSALLGRQLNLRRWDESFRNLAVYAYYAEAGRLDPPAEGNIFIESYANGWLWTIPLPAGQASVGAVVDGIAGAAQAQQLGLAPFLDSQLAQGPHTAQLLAAARRVSAPQLVKDWSYACDPLAGDGYALLGDAACFIDPLFSSGVHLALMSGVLAAAYATTALRRPEMAAAAAKVYQDLYAKEYHHFRELVRLFYSSNRTAESYFWAARRILEGDFAGDGDSADLSPRQSFIRAVAGQPPRGYERMALERGQPPASFAATVREVETDRAARQARMTEWLTAPPDTPPPLYYMTPRLHPDARLVLQPVVGDGEFQWGYALLTASHPEGLPCSDLVAAIVARLDGQTTVASLLSQLAAGVEESQRPQLAANILAALQILYVDGTVADMGAG